MGIQDLGAAGVACATTELAAAGTGGMRVRLDAVPLRDPALGPPEILMSESQERMVLASSQRATNCGAAARVWGQPVPGPAPRG